MVACIDHLTAAERDLNLVQHTTAHRCSQQLLNMTDALGRLTPQQFCEASMLAGGLLHKQGFY